MPVEIGLLVFPNVQQLDLTGPYEVFASWPEARVRLIWKDRTPVVSVTGLKLTPDATFDDCPLLDVVCVPGGDGIKRTAGRRSRSGVPAPSGGVGAFHHLRMHGRARARGGRPAQRQARHDPLGLA